MKKIIINIFILFLITNYSYAVDLFASSYIKVEFISDNIEYKKNEEINNLKQYNLNKILKNILTYQDYIKLKNNINVNFADKFIRNIIIENESIINNTYSANIKIDLSKKLIIQFLRENKYSYVDYHPKSYFTLILEKNEIEKKLFSKNNSYYNYLINNKDKINFFKIPNLDVNDRFLVSPDDFYNKNYKKIKTIIDKYQYENNIVIFSDYKNNNYTYEIYTLNNEKLFLIDKYTFDNLEYHEYFDDLENRLLNFWKNKNSIQNNNPQKIECLVSAINIYELKEINSLINSISTITNINLLNIDLYSNMYELKFYGNKNILKNLFYNKSMDIDFSDSICKIKLK